MHLLCPAIADSLLSPGKACLSLISAAPSDSCVVTALLLVYHLPALSHHAQVDRAVETEINTGPARKPQTAAAGAAQTQVRMSHASTMAWLRQKQYQECFLHVMIVYYSL